MTLVTLDVVLVLPTSVRKLAIRSSRDLADLMDENDSGACFRLGEHFPGQHDGPCEPHISMFMMAVEDHEIGEVAAALAMVVPGLAPVPATAQEYRYNGEGAPELFYARSDEFRRVQRGVVAAAEPLRRGRLRALDPGGKPLAAVLDDPNPHDPDRVHQLQRYGFDDISDERHDRFNPHVTLTWPRDERFRFELSGLGPAGEFNGLLTDVALYAMSPNGTCTAHHGTWALGG